MASPAWWARRERWYRDQVLLTGRPPACAVCEHEWTLADDLHHTSYARLGHERHTDLVPMCRDCHEQLHQILDTSKHWRRLDRATATTQLITILRRHQADDSNQIEGDQR